MVIAELEKLGFQSISVWAMDKGESAGVVLRLMGNDAQISASTNEYREHAIIAHNDHKNRRVPKEETTPTSMGTVQGMIQRGIQLH